ncbi:MAG: hypothetical protein WC703_03495 [Candidatus Neomarinimicrobiota bacterium]
MKLGMIITQTDSETASNALRLTLYSLEQSDEVLIFLSGRDENSIAASPSNPRRSNTTALLRGSLCVSHEKRPKVKSPAETGMLAPDREDSTTGKPLTDKLREKRICG